MPSAYRDDQDIVEERLARLEESHVDRQRNRLLRLRASLEAEAPPPPPPAKASLWPTALLIMVNMNAIRACTTAAASRFVAYVVVVGCFALFVRSKSYRAWRHRRKQREALANADAALAALDRSLPMRVETSTLEAARARIAELEAEEAAAVEEAASEDAARHSTRP
jgi:hypothetical protein